MKILKWILLPLIAVMAGGALFVLFVHLGFFGHLHSKKELADFKNETATKVLSSDGVLLGKFFAVNRTNIQFNDLPSHVVQALVATEDERFFEHKGVDSESLLRVLVKTIILDNSRSGGGSTITQQLIKNMYGRKNFGPITMLVNKTKEALLAYRLEQIFSKEDILTLYLNTVPFGENVYGIESAAQLFYNKTVSKLTIDEGAVLIGILKANTYYNPRLNYSNALKRRNVVMSQMVKNEYLSRQDYQELSEKPIVLDYYNLQSAGPANYFITLVKKELTAILEQISKQGKTYDMEKDGLIVHTTLDSKAQKGALLSMQKGLEQKQKKLRRLYATKKKRAEVLLHVNERKSEGQNWNEKRTVEYFDWSGTQVDSISGLDSAFLSLTTLHAGMIGVKPNTGEICVYVGGIDYRFFPYDQIQAKKQMASSFKPILYAAGLEKGISPCVRLDNHEKVYEDFDNWSPANYDHSSGGTYSMAGALSLSKNLPTVDLFFKVGYDELDYLWRKLGFTSVLKNVPSVSLGIAEASIMESAMAYAAFANGGQRVEAYTITKILNRNGEVIYEKQLQKHPIIMEENTACVINEILQKAIDSGTGTAIRTQYHVSIPLAGKTGTSQNFGDAWFVGYNPGIVLVSRVGATYSDIHFNSGADGSGGRLALPLVAEVLRQIEKNGLLKSRYVVPFVPIDSIINEMDCPDFEEDSTMDKVLDIFKSKSTTTQKAQRKTKKKQRKKGWFKKRKDK